MTVCCKKPCAVIFSIRRKYSEMILSGVKKYEFRKTKFLKNVNRAFIYECSPTCLIVGEFEICNILEGTPEDIWEFTKKFSGITEDFYSLYYKNSIKAVAYEIHNPVKYSKGFKLEDFGLTKAPQSYGYVYNKQLIPLKYF